MKKLLMAAALTAVSTLAHAETQQVTEEMRGDCLARLSDLHRQSGSWEICSGPEAAKYAAEERNVRAGNLARLKAVVPYWGCVAEMGEIFGKQGDEHYTAHAKLYCATQYPIP